MMRHFRKSTTRPMDLLVGVGGIGTGMFFDLDGDHTLGRNESRPGRLLDVRDYCKLHIIAHYIAVLLGAQTSGNPFCALPVGKVGDDPQGRRLIEEMAAAGMDTSLVDVVSGKPTLLSVCFQYPDASGGNITTSNSAAAGITAADIERADAALRENAGRSIALAAPEVPLDVRRRLLELATEHGAMRVASFTSAEMPQAAAMGMFGMVDLLAVNEDEAAALTGSEFEPEAVDKFLDDVAGRLTDANPTMKIIVSAGGAGAYGFDDGKWSFSPAVKVDVASTAGAGDALLGSATAALAAGASLKAALDFAVVFAGYTVTSPHTIHPDAGLENVVRFAGEINAVLPGEIMELTED